MQTKAESELAGIKQRLDEVIHALHLGADGESKAPVASADGVKRRVSTASAGASQVERHIECRSARMYTCIVYIFVFVCVHIYT